MGDIQEPGGSCLQSTSNQRQVSPVLYLFIHLLVLSTGRSHYFLRYKVFGFVIGMDNTPCRWIPGWLTCLMRPHFPWSLLIPLLLIMIWAFQFGNNKITPWKENVLTYSANDDFKHWPSGSNKILNKPSQRTFWVFYHSAELFCTQIMYW